MQSCIRTSCGGPAQLKQWFVGGRGLRALPDIQFGLQTLHAATMFLAAARPPVDLGTRCSALRLSDRIADSVVRVARRCTSQRNSRGKLEAVAR